MLGLSSSPCRRFHPAEVEQPRRSDFGCPCCLRPSVAGSAFGAIHFRGHIRVHFRYGPVTRTFPSEGLSIGFRALVSLLPAIQATGLLISAPAGLSPAEQASLRWTHNRTCRSPASGSRTRSHAFAHDCWRRCRSAFIRWQGGGFLMAGVVRSSADGPVRGHLLVEGGRA